MSMRQEDEMPYQDDSLLQQGSPYRISRLTKTLASSASGRDVFFATSVFKQVDPSGKKYSTHQPTAENSGLGLTAWKYSE